MPNSIHAAWLTHNDDSIFYRRYAAENNTKGSVVMVPPIAHEGFHSHRFFCTLAHTLCRSGYDVYRIDLPGYGNSSGDTTDKTIHTRWAAHINAVIDSIASKLPVTLLGLRYGANLCLLAEADHYVLIEPIVNTKRYAREISATSRMASKQNRSMDGIESAGFIYTGDFIDWLKNQKICDSYRHKALTVFGQEIDQLNDRFESWETRVVSQFLGITDILAEPQFTKVPKALIEKVQLCIGQVKTRTLSIREPISVGISSSLVFPEFEERVFTDALGQFGIITQPTNTETSGTVVLLNSGSGPHTGPNRLYVKLCRDLASKGIRTLRVDLQNLGESATPEIPQENHCYPDKAVDYCMQWLEALDSVYPDEKITLLGICSGAHHSFHTAIAGHHLLKRLILINPLTFYWHTGMSLKTPQNQQVTVDTTYYARAVKDPRSWLKLFSGKADVRYISSYALKFLVKKGHQFVKSFNRLIHPIPHTDFNRDIADIVKRNVDVSILVSDADPGWGLIADASQMSNKRFCKHFKIDNHTIDNSNHTFSTQASQNLLSFTLNDLLSKGIKI